jgi:hypothetical protein
VVKEQALDGFVDDDYAGQKQQAGFDEGGEIFHLAVTVLMVGVGGLVGDAHREEGNGGGDQIEEGVRGLGQNTQAASGDADKNLEGGDGYGREHGVGGYGALFRAHGFRTELRT